MDPEALNLGKVMELGSKEGDRRVMLRFDDSSETFVLCSKGIVSEVFINATGNLELDLITHVSLR